jgi:glycosyltransferase involved in cell wall biosynthesis
MPTPRVSICVPTYNGADYLEECFTAIAAQTFRDFEVLVVDDCSRDDGVEIARRWAARDERFQVHVNEKNQGLVGNWNRCIDLARGEWIKFLFQDDIMAPECLAEMLQAGEGGGGLIACSRDFLFEGDWAPELKQLYFDHRKTLTGMFGEMRHATPDDYCRIKLDRLDINIVGEPSVTLIKRELFERFGYFDPMLVQICDSEMWTRLACNVGLDFVAKDLVTFRVHAASASETNRARPFRSMILEGIIESWKFCEDPQFAALRDHAGRHGRLNALREQLQTQINIAFYMARDADREKPPNRKIRGELVEVLNRLSGYSQARNRYLLFRFRRMLGLAKAVP